jgi:uncharacterized protein YcaQ
VRQTTLQQLRDYAITHSLFPPTTLKRAIRTLGFVQADPIRAPARAQDLILRHRVNGYVAGDLERRYGALDIEEDYLYAYGFLPRTVWQHLHPRQLAGMSASEKKVLQVVSRFGVMHPKELQAHLGDARVVNAWGGYSKATTRALEDLHYRGLLRIARRENGIRLYEPAPALAAAMPAEERLTAIILTVAGVLAPIDERTLFANLALYRRLGSAKHKIQGLVESGELVKAVIDGVTYLWPRSRSTNSEAPRTVRFLAPFDPVVWDRRRFEHFWGWPYRFEAYTPPAKRVRGYYALLLLWRDTVPGWANIFRKDGMLTVETGFVAGTPPAEPDFNSALEQEIARLHDFLGMPVDQVRS